CLTEGVRGCTPSASYVSSCRRLRDGRQNGVRNASVWARLLGLVRAVIESVVFDDDVGALVVSVRPRKGARRRCGRCGRRAPWYDRGGGRRRWRGLDLGTIRVFLEADAPRVNCPTHGPTVIQVPWARHGAGHTR